MAVRFPDPTCVLDVSSEMRPVPPGMNSGVRRFRKRLAPGRKSARTHPKESLRFAGSIYFCKRHAMRFVHLMSQGIRRVVLSEARGATVTPVQDAGAPNN